MYYCTFEVKMHIGWRKKIVCKKYLKHTYDPCQYAALNQSRSRASFDGYIRWKPLFEFLILKPFCNHNLNPLGSQNQQNWNEVKLLLIEYRIENVFKMNFLVHTTTWRGKNYRPSRVKLKNRKCAEYYLNNHVVVWI